MRRTTIGRWLVLAALGGASIGAASLASRASAQVDEDYWVDVGDDSGGGGESSPAGRAPRSGSGIRLGQIGMHEIPPTYSVRRGDTLWDITGHHYGNPWEWPRVWSYNPEITNPHWIYPDQIVRLLADGAPVTVTAARGSGIVVRRGVETGTVFLREAGWLDAEALETSGEIVGSPDDHMLLAPFDQVYVRFDRLPEGQSEPAGEYTIYRSIEADDRAPAEQQGTLVRILGTVRIDSWDPDRHTARAMITEALDPIERGYAVAALPRRFDVVPPVRSEIDLDTEVVATLMPTELVGDQQIVFVPVGEEDGLRVGNRFFIVRAGDEWRSELQPAQEQGASVPPPAEPEELPDEVIAEARVVAVRPHSANLLVTRATLPVSVGDRAQVRRGY